MENNLLKKLNKFTRREFKEDEVYIFSVILCDNETDRDNEKFSLSALSQMKSLFIGKTGIFDHNAKSSNQTARIFDTEIISDETKITKSGEPYTYLKATAYMVRTKSNEDLIKEIEGGIKKEVSVSCRAEKRICSVCSADTLSSSCNHRGGKKYGNTECFFTLSDISDAYEWSFVAVPAQVNAGVTKSYENEELLKRATRLCFLASDNSDIKNMSYEELSFLCEKLEKKTRAVKTPENKADNSPYMMKRGR